MVGEESMHLGRKLALTNRQIPVLGLDLGGLTETVTHRLLQAGGVPAAPLPG
jgi:hypothetical protein